MNTEVKRLTRNAKVNNSSVQNSQKHVTITRSQSKKSSAAAKASLNSPSSKCGIGDRAPGNDTKNSNYECVPHHVPQRTSRRKSSSGRHQQAHGNQEKGKSTKSSSLMDHQSNFYGSFSDSDRTLTGSDDEDVSAPR